MNGVNAAMFGDLATASNHPVLAAGGIARLEDLHQLSARGVAGAVLGMSIYTGGIDARTAAREFAA